MNLTPYISETEMSARQITRATVVKLTASGQFLCQADLGEMSPLQCHLLHASEGPPLQLAPGDQVLVWLASPEETKGIILGRIGPSNAPTPTVETPKESIPGELVLEAKQQLTLKCGDGSITLREDGKVLIKGKDLVSRAQRTNRIKGGSVAIN
ncbi:MAG: hypothetical protein AB7P49_20375 [Bdellovibrionales bacterium]